MKTFIFNDKLEDFLKEKKIKTKFCKNIFDYCKTVNEDFFDRCEMIDKENKDAITTSFIFKDSPEGIDYWYSIDKEYQKLFKPWKKRKAK
jgi:hypothetical protein